MQSPAKRKASNQLIFSILLLLIAVGGYFATKEYAPGSRREVQNGLGDITLEGSFSCVPQKAEQKLDTLPCVLGLVTESSGNYLLDDNSQLTEQGIPNNAPITVVGEIVSMDAVQPNPWEAYDFHGVMKVERITAR
jgi:hypothetical protein